ncbi:hypothetical protein ACWD3I_26010 [Streptomyces sp. NPDC002817]|uniref:hypothetical protein n=1 Tax=Streptomyces sp. NPDC088357 TaxID=3154655 RepID=UPI003426493C
MRKHKPHSTSDNPARVEAVQNRRRSGASGTHVSGPRRARDRRGGQRAAIRFSADAG